MLSSSARLLGEYVDHGTPSGLPTSSSSRSAAAVLTPRVRTSIAWLTRAVAAVACSCRS